MKTKITIEDINKILNEIDLEEDNLWNKMNLNNESECFIAGQIQGLNNARNIINSIIL